jgi:haloacetate dehalogenase
VTELFPGFAARRLPCDRGEIFARVAMADRPGPPVLLLHGYPQTHLMWHGVAPLLAQRGFTVVAADLAGYGASIKPTAADDHAPHSKRAMALDCVQAMAALGHDRFAVAGHDRGGRVAYRMTLDHPGTVTGLSVLDIVPTAEVWRRTDSTSAVSYWHWSFLAQPAPLPERLILGAPDDWFQYHVQRMGIGSRPERYPDEVVEAYRRQLLDPDAVQAMCEDYRAGATIDRELDEADRTAGRTIDCPVQALWGTRGALPRFYEDVLGVWREWAGDLRGRGVEASHFLPEDEPEEVVGELADFFSETRA